MIHHTKAINSFDDVKVQLRRSSKRRWQVSKTTNLRSLCAKQADLAHCLAPCSAYKKSKVKLRVSVKRLTHLLNVNFLRINNLPIPRRCKKNGWIPTTLLSRIWFDPRRDSHDGWTSAIYPWTSSAIGGFKSPCGEFSFWATGQSFVKYRQKIRGDCDIVRHHACRSTLVAVQWGRYDYRAGIGSRRHRGMF